MKVGDLIQFTGSWGSKMKHPLPNTGIITGVWTNGRKGKISHVDVIWDTGDHGNVMALAVEVINESR